MSASILGSGGFTHQFRLNYLETANAAIGDFVSSPDFSAGGHLWRIHCFPRGESKEDNGEYVSMFLELLSKSEDNVEAIFEVSVMHRDGTLSLLHMKRIVHVYPPDSDDPKDWGWPRFVERSLLESLYVTNGSFIIVGAIKVIRDDSIDVPPSIIGRHLELLLDSTDGSDVSFIVDGEKFPAHRAVLAARSPVFKSQLLGSMAKANMSSIILHDISPETFRVMLRFIYTDDCAEDDELWEDDELGDSPCDMVLFQNLLVAADRFALDRLKIVCAAFLRDNMSVDTAVETLICAETYNCPQLKKKCIDFIAEEKNFKKVVLTDGYIHLGQQFPSILDELRMKVGA